MAKRSYREWELQCREVVVRRLNNGQLMITQHVTASPTLDAREARRLFQKLSGDYRD